MRIDFRHEPNMGTRRTACQSCWPQHFGVRVEESPPNVAPLTIVLVMFFMSLMPDIEACPRCGSEMVPWRHSQTWRAWTCWACEFVRIEKISDGVPEGRVEPG